MAISTINTVAPTTPNTKTANAAIGNNITIAGMPKVATVATSPSILPSQPTIYPSGSTVPNTKTMQALEARIGASPTIEKAPIVATKTAPILTVSTAADATTAQGSNQPSNNYGVNNFGSATNASGQTQYDIARMRIAANTQRQRQAQEKALSSRLAARNIEDSGIADRESRLMQAEMSRQSGEQYASIDMAELNEIQARANLSFQDAINDQNKFDEQRYKSFYTMGVSGQDLSETEQAELLATDPQAYYSYLDGKGGKSIADSQAARKDLETFRTALISAIGDTAGTPDFEPTLAKIMSLKINSDGSFSYGNTSGGGEESGGGEGDKSIVKGSYNGTKEELGFDPENPGASIIKPSSGTTTGLSNNFSRWDGGLDNIVSGLTIGKNQGWDGTQKKISPIAKHASDAQIKSGVNTSNWLNTHSPQVKGDAGYKGYPYGASPTGKQWKDATDYKGAATGDRAYISKPMSIVDGGPVLQPGKYTVVKYEETRRAGKDIVRQIVTYLVDANGKHWESANPLTTASRKYNGGAFFRGGHNKGNRDTYLYDHIRNYGNVVERIVA